MKRSPVAARPHVQRPTALHSRPPLARMQRLHQRHLSELPPARRRAGSLPQNHPARPRFHAQPPGTAHRLRPAPLRLPLHPGRRPDDFSITTHLGDSFGVFRGKGRHRVRLRFDPFAAHLVGERQWHPSQKISPLPGGEIQLTLNLQLLSTHFVKPSAP